MGGAGGVRRAARCRPGAAPAGPRKRGGTGGLCGWGERHGAGGAALVRGSGGHAYLRREAAPRDDWMKQTDVP